MYLNNVVLDYSTNRVHKGYLERIQLHPTVYLDENDIIDFYFVTSAVSNWNQANFYIYAMTN